MRRGLVIPADLAEPIRAVTADSLADTQALVGGDIEPMPHDAPVSLYCNEEGKILGLAFNARATYLWALLNGTTVDQMTDYAAGDCAAFGFDIASGDDVDLQPEMVALIHSLRVSVGSPHQSG